MKWLLTFLMAFFLSAEPVFWHLIVFGKKIGVGSHAAIFANRTVFTKKKEYAWITLKETPEINGHKNWKSLDFFKGVIYREDGYEREIAYLDGENFRESFGRSVGVVYSFGNFEWEEKNYRGGGGKFVVYIAPQESVLNEDRMKKIPTVFFSREADGRTYLPILWKLPYTRGYTDDYESFPKGKDPSMVFSPYYPYRSLFENLAVDSKRFYVLPSKEVVTKLKELFPTRKKALEKAAEAVLEASRRAQASPKSGKNKMMEEGSGFGGAFAIPLILSGNQSVLWKDLRYWTKYSFYRYTGAEELSYVVFALRTSSSKHPLYKIIPRGKYVEDPFYSCKNSEECKKAISYKKLR